MLIGHFLQQFHVVSEIGSDLLSIANSKVLQQGEGMYDRANEMLYRDQLIAGFQPAFRVHELTKFPC